MSGSPKFLITNQNGVQLGQAQQYQPDTTDISHIVSGSNTYTAYQEIQAAKDSQFIFSGTNPYYTVSGTTLYTLCYFLYQGSNVIQKPSSITAITWVTGGTGTIRIQDITNNLTIASATTTATATASILNLGTISNIPTGAAVWAIQMSVTGVLTNINIAALMVSYS